MHIGFGHLKTYPLLASAGRGLVEVPMPTLTTCHEASNPLILAFLKRIAQVIVPTIAPIVPIMIPKPG